MSAVKSGSHSNPVKTWKLNKRKTVKQVSAFSAVHYDFIIKFPVQMEGKCLLAFHVNSLLKRFVTLFILSMLCPIHRAQGTGNSKKNSSLHLPANETSRKSSTPLNFHHEDDELSMRDVNWEHLNSEKFLDWLWVKLSKENPLSNLSLELSRATLKNVVQNWETKRLNVKCC